jgi:hypothetical protein
MPKGPEEMHAAIIGNVQEKTGRSLEEWLALINAYGAAPRPERMEWLKTEHGLGHVTASRLLIEADKPAGYLPPSPEALLDAQFAGDKAALRPIYERLTATVCDVAPEASIEPRSSMVSLVRGKQFGIIQATTKTRLDLGLRLKGVEPTERLQKAGSFGSDVITHKVGLSFPSDVDDEVTGWIKEAYEKVRV